MIKRHYVVVGIDSSYSDKRSEALSPLVPRSAGEKFWRMTGLTMEQYSRVFSRDNLFFWLDKRRSIERRKEAARAVISRLDSQWLDVRVIALGRVVAEAFGMVNTQVPLIWRGHTVLVPHPSGLNRWYNDESNARRAQAFVRGIAAEAMGFKR